MMYLHLLAVVICYTSSVSGQRSLGLTFDRLDFSLLNLTIVEACGKTSHINRTTRGLDMDITYLKRLPEDSKFKAAVHTFRGNVYRLTAIQMESTIRDAIRVKYFDLASLFKAYDPPMVWPLLTNVTYKLRKFIPDTSKLPSYLPEYKFKFAVQLWWGTEMPYMYLDIYVSLTSPSRQSTTTTTSPTLIVGDNEPSGNWSGSFP